MKRLKNIALWGRLLPMSVALLTFAACSSDEDGVDNPNKWICIYPESTLEAPFTLDADSVPHFKNMHPMSATEFSERIVGYGWHCNGLQIIYNDGSYSNDNLVGTLFGIGPTHYEFAADKLTEFIYVDSRGNENGGMMYRECVYSYDEKTGDIKSADGTKLQLFSYLDDGDNHYFYAIYKLGTKSNGVPNYCVATFQRMTEAELKETRETYSLNYYNSDMAGAWPFMVWRDKDGLLPDDCYDVLPYGGQFTFTCENYQGVWFSEGREDGTLYFPSDNYYLSLTGKNFYAVIVGNKLTINFKANKGESVRTTLIGVTAGDIFKDFKFRQQPQEQE